MLKKGISISDIYIFSAKVVESVPESVSVQLEETNYDSVDMDTSRVAQKFIETDVPVSELLIEKHQPKSLLLDPLYEESLFDDYDIDRHLDSVERERVIVDIENLQMLFKKCYEENCTAEIDNVETRFMGCSINIHWRCKLRHKGICVLVKYYMCEYKSI